jgi:hypothetical protein
MKAAIVCQDVRTQPDLLSKKEGKTYKNMEI